MTPTTPHYTLVAERDGAYWFLQVRERPDIFGQAQTRDEIEATGRDLIAIALDVPPDSFTMEVHAPNAKWAEIKREYGARQGMPRDPNQRAKAVVDIATGQRHSEPAPAKDPAAVARGKLGGVIGGARRAANMTAEQRSESARRAANARWQKERSA